MLTPSQLLIALDEEVTLPDMIDVGNEYLEALTVMIYAIGHYDIRIRTQVI